MKTGFAIAALGAGLGVFLCGAAAQAATITDQFTFTNSANTVIADGSFSYDSSHSGQLSYADLSAFTINLAFDGASYDLAFVNSVSNFIYFGYDTATNAFVGSPGLHGTVPGTYYSYLSAITDNFSAGFFVIVPAHGEAIRNYPSQNDANYTSYSITQVSETPIPPALPLFVSALGGLGYVGWRCRRAMA
jgi:hypothetical protein